MRMNDALAVHNRHIKSIRNFKIKTKFKLRSTDLTHGNPLKMPKSYQVQTVSSERELFAAFEEAVRVIDPDILVSGDYGFKIKNN